MSEEVVPVPPVFNYPQDITLNVSDNTYKIQTLLDMSSEEFDAIYAEYNVEIGKQMAQIQQDPRAGLAMMGALSVIDMMERVRLERRILALESN